MPELRRDVFVLHAEADLGWVNGYFRPALGLAEGRLVAPGDFTPGAPVLDEFEHGRLAADRCDGYDEG